LGSVRSWVQRVTLSTETVIGYRSQGTLLGVKQEQLEILADALAASKKPAWVRAAAARPDSETWLLHCVEVTVGAPPPSWNEVDWQYPVARLNASQTSTRDVAEALRSGQFYVGDLRPQVASLSTTATIERRASREQYGAHESLEWPSDETRIGITGTWNAMSGDLIAEHMPPFATYDLALANLFGLTHHVNWNPPQREVVIRVMDTRARIRHVYVDTTYIEATVDGDALNGTALTLAADTPGEARALGSESQQKIRFETPTGTPAGAWLPLTLGGELLDRRRLALDRLRVAEPGVEYAPPPFDPNDDSPFSPSEQAEIQRVISFVKMDLRLTHGAGDTEAVRRIEEKLDAAVAAAETVGRGSWRDQLRGALLGLVLDRVVPAGIVEYTFHALHSGIGLLLSAHTTMPLPTLPTF
jgi:hypothetical protein